jgi:outer membrane protein OmpA-like peptidoglycan-associated protein
MKKLLYAVLATLMIGSGCASLNNTQKGTGVGVAAGGVAGLLIGHSVAGVLIGSAVGGSAGYLIGSKMDKQAKEIKQNVPNATVERVGEGIGLTFNSGLLFKINSSVLSDTAHSTLDKLGDVLVKYPDENILIEGYTDDTGSADFNMKLSEQRANAVANYLQTKGIPASRLQVKWFGETQPKYPNDSEANREKNRRVEIGIYANDKMKSDAQQSSTKN